jgi:hypothetical protein
MMKNISISLLITLVLASCSAQKTEEKLVRKSFDAYKAALLIENGDEAVKYVDSKTLEYYSEILEKTINADSQAVNSLGIMDKLMVLTIRHHASKGDILSFDSKSLLVYAFNEGMVGKESVANNTIGKVDVEGTFAKGQLLVNGVKAPFSFSFNKEAGTWKIDLTSIFSIGSAAFSKMVEESGQNENDYLFMLLEMVTGNSPKAEIWNPIE